LARSRQNRETPTCIQDSSRAVTAHARAFLFLGSPADSQQRSKHISGLAARPITHFGLQAKRTVSCCWGVSGSLPTRSARTCSASACTERIASCFDFP
jgi:hypothetical protein